VPQGSVLFPTLYTLYINNTPQNLGVYWSLFADDTCLYSTDREECYVLRKIQRGLTAMESWCERWNIKINEKKTRVISPIGPHQSKLPLHWKEGTFRSQTTWNT
jgi:hypothetical protein